MLPFDDEPVEVPKPPEVKKPRKPKETAPATVSAPVQCEPRPMTEDRSARRFNTVLRRFIVNGYRMESMLGKYRVWRGEKALTGWKPTFVSAIDEIMPELMDGSEFPDNDRTLYQQIAELKGLLCEVAENSPLREKIEETLSKYADL